MSDTWQPPISHLEVDALATGLIAELSQHAGDPQQVAEVLRDWLTQQDLGRLAFIGLAVVRDVFSHYLTRVELDDVPAGALVLKEGTQP